MVNKIGSSNSSYYVNPDSNEEQNLKSNRVSHAVEKELLPDLSGNKMDTEGPFEDDFRLTASKVYWPSKAGRALFQKLFGT